MILNVADFTVDYDNNKLSINRKLKMFCHNNPKQIDYYYHLPLATLQNEYAASNLSMTIGSYEFCQFLRSLAEWLPINNSVFLHSALFECNGIGLAFAAASGTGKTTQMLNWQKLLGDKMTIVNGDKPIVRFFDKAFCEKKGLDIPEGTVESVPYAYGTPWNGKENFGTNTRTTLKHICFIERSETNFVTKIEKHEAIDRIMKQVYIPKDPEALKKTLELVNRLINSCNLWIIHCNMEPESAEIAYETIIGE